MMTQLWFESSSLVRRIKFLYSISNCFCCQIGLFFESCRGFTNFRHLRLPPAYFLSPWRLPRMSLAATGGTLFGGKKSTQKIRRGCVDSNSRYGHSLDAVHATSPRTHYDLEYDVVHSRAGVWASRVRRPQGVSIIFSSCRKSYHRMPRIAANNPRLLGKGGPGAYAQNAAGMKYNLAIASGVPGGSFDPFLGGKKGVPATASCIRGKNAAWAMRRGRGETLGDQYCLTCN